MQQLKFEAASEGDTRRLGNAIADCLESGITIGLTGTLGAGKTRLVQTIAARLGIDEKTVVSPTFSLVHSYAGRMNVVHIDAFRIKDADEFLELGVDEYIESEAVVVIEWAERFADCLPPDVVWIRIELDDSVRTFEILQTVNQIDPSDAYGAFITCLSKRLSQ